MKNKLLLSAIIFFSALSLAAFKEHHRIIDRGEFDGFIIGMSKLAALENTRKLNVPSISGVQKEQYKSFSIEDFQIFDLSEWQGLGVGGQGLNIIVYFSDELVSEVVSTGPNQLSNPISIGDTKEAVKLSLLEEYRLRSDLSVSSQIRGHGPDSSKRSAGTKSEFTDPDMVWLLDQSNWLFRRPDSQKVYQLEFSNGVLRRVEYWNHFVGLP